MLIRSVLPNNAVRIENPLAVGIMAPPHLYAGPLDDTKRFLAPSGPWGSEGRGLGKQQQQQQLSLGDTARWPSPLAPPSSASIDSIPPSSAPAAPLSWQGGMDPRKFVPWSQQTAVTPQPPPPAAAAAPQRFHLRQNTSVLPAAVSSGASASASSSSTQPLRLLAPNANHQHHTHPHHAPSTTTALLRTDIARQLMLLGFHDDAGALLSDNGIEDLEKFLCKLLFIVTLLKNLKVDHIGTHCRQSWSGSYSCCK